MKSNQRLVVYVDVDDTLLRSAGTKTMPMPRVVEHVKDLAKSGAEPLRSVTAARSTASVACCSFGV